MSYSPSEVAYFQQPGMQHLLLVTEDGQSQKRNELRELDQCPDAQKAEVLLELRRGDVPSVLSGG